MLKIKQHWQKTIDSANAEDYDEQCMYWMNEMKIHHPKLERDLTRPFLAYLTAEIEESIPENAKDRCNMKGIHKRCEDCEFFKFPTTRTGEPDRRAKRGTCVRASIKTAFCESDACVEYYEIIEKEMEKEGAKK